ncbi:dna repair protein rhp54 [Hordeum vulgare]|nr:dna repair protein rhp54 [Hordeum vulgare]
MPVDMLINARNLFDGMPATVDDDTANRFLENMMFEGGAPAAGVYDPDETQSQDDRAPFTQATYDPHDAFMQDKVGLDGFPLDHEFLEGYGLEEEDDDMDIDMELLFEGELTNQTAAGAKPKRKSKPTKTYTPAKDKLLCVPRFGGIQGSAKQQSLPTLPLLDYHQRGEEVQGAICRPLGAWGKEALQDHGDGEKAWPRGKTNSKKDDRQDATSIALLEKVGGHDKQEGLEGGESPTRKGRENARVHGNPKAESRDGRKEAIQDA